jgi:AbrB family looped-hinge helix DNA binding protein
MAVNRNLVRVQEKGQVTLPASVRKRLGLKKGDLVAVVETPEGVLITPQEVVATRALAQIGEVLKEQGLSLEDMIESGREIREELFREQHSLESPSESD